MPFEQQPSPLADVILAQTYNAQWFSGSTNELKITAAIAAAVADGAKYVLVPKNMYPYIAANVTFNSAVRIIREGNLTDQFDVVAYGADNTGVNENLISFQTAVNHASIAKGIVYIPSGSYKLTGTVNLASNIKIIATGATITQYQNAVQSLYGLNVSNVEITGGKWVGPGASVVFSDVNAGLIHFTMSGSSTNNNIRINDTEVSNAYSCISAIRCINLWIENNYIHNFLRWGVCASQGYNWHVTKNTITDCEQTGAANAYAITATGDLNTVGYGLVKGEISFNHIENIPSWDGFMSHECQGLIIHGNMFKNVRQGIDIGPLANNAPIEDVVITDNIITATQTNTYGVTSAPHAAVQLDGFDATHLAKNVVVRGNIAKDFYTQPSMVIGGKPGAFCFSTTDGLLISDNCAINTGNAAGGYAGIWMQDKCNRVVIEDNMVQGAMLAGAIRVNGATIDSLSIQNNTIKQTTASDNGVLINTSTVTTLVEGGNNTNSTTPLVISSSTVGYMANNGRVSADRGDNAVTLGANEAEIQRFATALTANRVVTLPSSGVFLGMHYRIVRTGLGAFTLDVGGLKTIPAGTAAYVDVTHDGTAFRLTGYGTL